MQKYDLESLMIKPFLTVDEAANYLNISRSSMYNRVNSGEMPAIRIGRLIRISRATIDALTVDHRDAATLGPPLIGRPQVSSRQEAEA